MNQIANHHVCPKRAVYLDPGICSNVSLCVVGSYPSCAMPSSHLRQATICTNSISSPLSIKAPLKKLPGFLRVRRGPGYELVVLEKPIT